MLISLHPPVCHFSTTKYSSRYRLAPKHLFPAAVDDCEAAIRDFLSVARQHGVDPQRVAVLGKWLLLHKTPGTRYTFNRTVITIEWFSPSACLSVCLSVTPFSLFPCRIITKFLGFITNDRNDAHVKGLGQRSKVKVTEVKTQSSRFRTVTPV